MMMEERPSRERASARIDMDMDGKLNPDDVNYREADDPQTRCKECVSFDGRNGCVQVAGPVDAAGVCDLFENIEGVMEAPPDE